MFNGRHAATTTVWVLLLVLAVATLLDFLLELVLSAPSGWLWFDHRIFPGPTGRMAGILFSLALILCPFRGRVWNRRVGLVALFFALFTFLDEFRLKTLEYVGDVADLAPISASAALGILLVVFAWIQTKGVEPPRNRRLLLIMAGPAALIMMSFQMYTFGESDYRRQADAALVFGARVYPNGRLSGALLDRVDTACRLWHDGLVSKLVLSGGRNPGFKWSEPEAMRERCLENGIPAHALVLDENGVDTLASIRFAQTASAQHEIRRWLMVSHDYHLARVKVRAERAGLQAFTVPARENHTLRHKWRFVIRELAAILVAYVDPRVEPKH